jgi:hypothetical protein
VLNYKSKNKKGNMATGDYQLAATANYANTVSGTYTWPTITYTTDYGYGTNTYWPSVTVDSLDREMKKFLAGFKDLDKEKKEKIVAETKTKTIDLFDDKSEDQKLL